MPECGAAGRDSGRRRGGASGNVFKDIGFPREEAAHLLLFSIDTLVEMLTRLGVEVTLKTKRRSRVA